MTSKSGGPDAGWDVPEGGSEAPGKAPPGEAAGSESADPEEEAAIDLESVRDRAS
ncbi:MAG TPA: hypothetical protein VGA98_12405 [Allosphingosinicella sp.]|jgi:hypothetical protein